MNIRSTAACTILAAMAATQWAQAGWQYTSVTSTEAAGSRKKIAQTTVTAWVEGKKSRMEYRESDQPMFKAGAYMLTEDGGQTMYLVNPPERTYSKWDMQAMMNMAGGAMQMMNMQFSGMKVEKLLEEAGENICGFPTRHYKIRTSYSMTMNFMGMKQVSDVAQEQDIWATTKLDAAGFGAWLKASEFKTGNEELDKLIHAETGKVQGFPLKTERVQTSKSAKGKEQVTKSISLVTEIKEAKIADSQFVLPTGYKETPLVPTAETSEATSEGSAASQGAKANPFLDMMKRMPKRAP